VLSIVLLIWTALHTAALAQESSATVPARNGVDSAVVSSVLAAQVMLDRLGFSPGEIDGRAGPNLERALAAFQQSRGLSVSGRMDDATSMRLMEEAGEEPLVTTYTLTEADVAGPFQPEIPKDLVEQSKLQALDYGNPLEALAEKFHASPALLQSLNTGQSFASAGEQIVVPYVGITKGAANTIHTTDTTHTKDTKDTDTKGTKGVNGTPQTRARIVVTKRTSALTVEDEDGRVLFHAPVTTGSKHDPLPIGEWKVTGVQESPMFHYNPALFWDADPSHSKARIAAGPNNPVGVAWIDINKEHYGIHGTPEPSTVGRVQSHGCVRMTNWDIRRVLEWARPGTPVIFR
jgi:lipoprotein-anchoring transpeptidase ErfK/SrfK